MNLSQNPEACSASVEGPKTDMLALSKDINVPFKHSTGPGDIPIVLIGLHSVTIALSLTVKFGTDGPQ